MVKLLLGNLKKKPDILFRKVFEAKAQFELELVGRFQRIIQIR